jgi:acyl-CoA synthetase (AMP-forming)/AMP-acid ligase II
LTALPPVPRTLPSLVVHTAAQHGDREAITDGTVRLNWRQVNDLRRRAGRAFIAAGVRKGDRIAIWAPNIHEWIIAAMGLQSLGAILVPLNTRFKGSEGADIIRRSNARLLFTVSGFLGIDYPAMLKSEPLPELERIILLRGNAAGLMTLEEFLATGDAVPDSELDALSAQVQPGDIMDIMFTSGTTGKPKGAMLTHEQNIRGYEQFSSTYGLRSGDAVLVIPPFFHSFGYKAGWLACTIFAARIVPCMTYDPEELIKVIEREKINVIPGPPTIFHGLLGPAARKQHDISSLRAAVTGAALVPEELVRRMSADLGFEVVNVAYGLTECTALVSQTSRDDPPVKIATTIGKPFKDLEVRCVDENGRDTPVGQPGEIVARGYLVMKGYFNDSQGTAAAIDANGFLHTGDVGLFDAEGYLHITDRIKDMYIVGGFNCYPAEIENALMQMPGVAQASVIGVPDERMGEVGKAFIIRRPGTDITAEQVIAWSREHMANFKVPRFVEFVDAYPMTASGKVLKTELRARNAGSAKS